MKKLFLSMLLTIFIGSYKTAAENLSEITDMVYEMAKGDGHLYVALYSGVVDYDIRANKMTVTYLPDSLSNIRSIDCYKGKVCIGLLNGHVFQLQNGKYEYIGATRDNLVNVLRFDSNGNMYVAARHLFKKTDTDWEMYSLPRSEIASSYGIYSMAAGGMGDLWLGGKLLFGGVYKYSDGQISSIDEDYTGIVTSLACDGMGNVLAGTSNKGVRLYQNGTLIANYTTSNSKLESNNSLETAIDENGTLWCGSSCLYKYENGDFVVYSMPENVNINNIMPYNGMLYLGTNKGLYYFVDGKIDIVNIQLSGINTSKLTKKHKTSVYTIQGIRTKEEFIKQGDIYIKNGQKIVR